MDPMETQQTKRARPQEERFRHPLPAWSRLVKKVLYLLVNVVELTIEIIRAKVPEELETETEDGHRNPYGPRPFNVFGPPTGPPPKGTLSETASVMSEWTHVTPTGTPQTYTPSQRDFIEEPHTTEYVTIKDDLQDTRLARGLQPSEDYNGREQPVPKAGPLFGLWSPIAEGDPGDSRGEAGGGGPATGKGRAEAEANTTTDPTDNSEASATPPGTTTGDEQRGIRQRRLHPGRRDGLPGVLGVQEVEERQEEMSRRAGIGMAPSQRRQSAAHLRNAAEALMETISLLQEEEPERAGNQRLQRAIGEQDLGQGNDRRPVRKYAEILNLNERQLKTAAELYNPERFHGESTRAGLIPGEAFDLVLGDNLLDPQTQQQTEKYFQTVKPGLTIISPPCTMFSQIQNMNRRLWEGAATARAYIKRLSPAKTLLRYAVRIANIILGYGGKFVFEHPLTSKVWPEKMMQELLTRTDVQMVRSDQCMFGLTSPSGIPLMKPTGWLTNSIGIFHALNRRCDEKHEHQHVLGSEAGTSRSVIAQEYPRPLVRAIMQGYRTDLKHHDIHIHLADMEGINQQQREAECYYQAALHEVEEANKDYTGWPVLAVEGAGEDDEPDDTINKDRYRYLPRERPFSLKALIKRAHDGLGHPGNDKFARILTNAKASEEAIKMAKQHQCSICQQRQKVSPARAAAPPRELQVNSIIGVDTVYLPGWDHRKRMALNIVDWSSRFQMTIPLQNHTPGEARRAYLQWVRFFGPAQRIYSDLGKEFKGAFEAGAELDSSYIDPGTLEMPTQRSITERAGKTFKETFSKALQHYTCNTKEEWTELVDITNMMCNRLINKSGFSPVQRVLGFTPRLAGGTP